MLVGFLLFSVIFSNTLASVALVKSHFSTTARWHSVAILFFSLWAVSSVSAEQYNGNINQNILFNSLAYVLSFAATLGLVMFSRTFLAGYKHKERPIPFKLLIGALIIFYGFLTVTPLIAGTVEVSSSGELMFLQGPLVGVFGAVFILFMLIVIKNLLARAKKGNYAEKNQARFIIFGLVSVTFIGLAVNIIVPALNPGFDSAGFFSALLTAMLVIPTSYALIQHRLVDVRPIAARGVAIVLLVLTVGAVYLLVIYILNQVFYDFYETSGAVLTFYALVMLTLGFIVHPLYTWYGNLLSKILLRKIYDSQIVINELNNVLVANLKIRALMPELQHVIRRNLDSKFTIIKLLQKNNLYTQGRVGKITRTNLAEVDVAIRNLQLAGKRVVSIRDIAVDPKMKELSTLMIKHHLDVIGVMKQGNTTLGVIYVSKKNSELPYTNQDLSLIEIIINQAGLAIQNALLYQEVSLLNSTLQQRVDDATKELRLTNAKLWALDQSKNQFISIASHQLRTPLTAIKGYLSLILEGSMGKVVATQRKALQQSLDNSHRMAFVVSDLLNLTRLKNGEFLLEKKPTKLADVVDAELKILAQQMKDKDLSLSYSKPDNFPTLMLDETKIRQVIKNFIYNSLFYTMPGGYVKVSLKEVNSRIELRVTDSGIGVPTKEQENLFTQFFRAKNAQVIRPDGTGVGLYIAKEVIESHGGKVIFESKLGKGSSFGFSFDKKQLALPKND